ncbi:MaoC/PaaZ C-terminal domain-containing protein [Pedobacter hartonius]|uniref:MaoC like domain-containing protein n=1 Tax=Pedobacter hartonius TaxID=425514 RepID=A0A1H4FPY9_9SPHI|nr:MaoC/PaaZ C-terminal domain-containing protein [Pedobacter hartonius]SEA99364.1 MaoC like domain-containing protein [Pedobacter hartonius]
MIFKVDDKFERSFIVSNKIYEGFLSIFNDNNPLHTDQQFAIMNGFREKVMHGNILNGFVSYFIGECLPIKNVIIHKQEIKFNNPVYLNDNLFFEAIVTDVFESVNAVEFKFNFKNEALKMVAKGEIQIGIL